MSNNTCRFPWRTLIMALLFQWSCPFECFRGSNLLWCRPIFKPTSEYPSNFVNLFVSPSNMSIGSWFMFLQIWKVSHTSHLIMALSKDTVAPSWKLLYYFHFAEDSFGYSTLAPDSTGECGYNKWRGRFNPSSACEEHECFWSNISSRFNLGIDLYML